MFQGIAIVAKKNAWQANVLARHAAAVCSHLQVIAARHPIYGTHPNMLKLAFGPR
jgi:hypothetical protein